ncbi:nicastrin-like isoform X1 [Rhagoletis pomonella]|uniref:nicastrin-like isoform X1 n=1 Tax=Rhagoletis pomonella TaxID=28610 RepID=UPI00177C00DC|nr:nicastrin-like isoform X1 [Rhagoletis pomonella]XP_036324667.1 nicastrin-like isoform X1 [Rhagoletis pomonella]
MWYLLKAGTFLLVLKVIGLNLVLAAESQRLHDLIYTPISGAGCFRRLNGTHQTGCSSGQSGSVGALHLIQVVEDFEFLLRNPPAPPYAPMIPPHLFTRQNMLRLKNAGPQNISVVLLINEVDKMTQFSHELTCPNRYSGLLLNGSKETATCDTRNVENSWNPWGTGLLHEDFPFPIYYIADEEEVYKLKSCFAKFNNFDYDGHATRSLCSVEVKTFMVGAVSSEVCMRRSNFINNLSRTVYCDPLEGNNVYGTLYPRKYSENTAAGESRGVRKVDPNEKFIVISCRMDTTSMFDGLGLGAMDSLTGYVTLMSLAATLKQYLPSSYSDLTKKINILFLIFNGESYDYIGSQRIVFDMENLDFPTRSTHTSPISFENIDLLIDIGTLDDMSTINVHTLTATESAKSFAMVLNSQGQKFNTQFELSIGSNLPPTSAQSFLRKKPAFPALILNSNPTNRYYHSIYDNAANLNFTFGNYTEQDYTKLMSTEEAFNYFTADSVQIKIRNVSTSIALTLTQMLLGQEYTVSRYASPILVDELLHCFLQSADCRLFDNASPVNGLPGLPIPPTRYISVASNTQETPGWTYRLFGLLLSSVEANITRADCVPLPLLWINGQKDEGECRRTTHNYSHALSPAFSIDNYDWKSGEYSTWTESTWMSFSARIFLRPSRVHEIVTLSIGIVVLIISFCLVYIISSRSDVLFEGATRSSDALTAPTAC